jgi:DNA-binding transcriptional LysR family regulator
MDLEALRTFIVVVDRGSLLGGAESLGVARATVRRHLESLEAATGAALLHRGRRGVVPTAAGELLARRGRLVLAEAQVLLDAVQGLGAEPAGIVRGTGPAGLPPVTLALALAALQVRWPRLRFDLRFSERPLDTLFEGAEIVLSLDRDPPEGPFVCVELPTFPERLLAAPSYLARHGPIASVEALAGHPVFLWRAPEGVPDRLPRLDGGSVPVQPALVSNDIHLLRLLAASGAGLAYTPDPALPEPAALGERPVPVLADVIGGTRPVRCVTPKALANLPKIQVILEAVRSVILAAN